MSPPVPFVVRKLRGNPGKRTLHKPIEPALLPKCPEPPAFLPPHAQAEWNRVAPELHVLGLLSSVDLACLSCYCHAYSLWREASEQLEAEGLLAETRDGRTCRNPLIKVVNDAAADMLSFAHEFGLTPVARTRASDRKQANSMAFSRDQHFSQSENHDL